MAHYDAHGQYVLTRVSHAFARFDLLSAAGAAGGPPREVRPHELWMLARGRPVGGSPAAATLTFRRGRCRTIAELQHWKHNGGDVVLLAFDESGRELARYRLLEARPAHWRIAAGATGGLAGTPPVLRRAKPGGANELSMDDTAGSEKIPIEELSLSCASMRPF